MEAPLQQVAYLAEILMDLKAPCMVMPLLGESGRLHVLLDPHAGVRPARLRALASFIAGELGAREVTVLHEPGEPLLEFQFTL